MPSGRLYKDGTILEDSKSRAVVERRRMGFAGCAFVAIAMTEKGELADDPEVDLVGIPEKNTAGELIDEIVFDAVVSTVEGLPRARRRDPDALAESVRRAVRAAINEHWGKKPLCLVHVLTIVTQAQGGASCWAGSTMSRSRSRTPQKAAKIYGAAFGAEISAAVPLPEHGVTTVFATLPNTKIEFIEPLGEASPIAKFLERNADGGIHHVCYEVVDIIAARDTLIEGGRAGARRRRAEDRRPRQAGAVPAPEGFFRRAGRNRAGLGRHGHPDLNRARDLLRHLVDRAVPDAAVRRAQPARGRRRGRRAPIPARRS